MIIEEISKTVVMKERDMWSKTNLTLRSKDVVANRLKIR